MFLSLRRAPARPLSPSIHMAPRSSAASAALLTRLTRAATQRATHATSCAWRSQPWRACRAQRAAVAVPQLAASAASASWDLSRVSGLGCSILHVRALLHSRVAVEQRPHARTGRTAAWHVYMWCRRPTVSTSRHLALSRAAPFPRPGALTRVAYRAPRHQARERAAHPGWRQRRHATLELPPVYRRLQPHAPEAAAPRTRGCNPTHQRLQQPHAPEAAAPRTGGCSPFIFLRWYFQQLFSTGCPLARRPGGPEAHPCARGRRSFWARQEEEEAEQSVT